VFRLKKTIVYVILLATMPISCVDPMQDIVFLSAAGRRETIRIYSEDKSTWISMSGTGSFFSIYEWREGLTYEVGLSFVFSNLERGDSLELFPEKIEVDLEGLRIDGRGSNVTVTMGDMGKKKKSFYLAFRQIIGDELKTVFLNTGKTEAIVHIDLSQFVRKGGEFLDLGTVTGIERKIVRFPH
jgi:hypothetical protein